MALLDSPAKNPNAAVGLLGGVGGGQIVINVAKLLGWDVSPGWALAVAGVASYVLLYIGREGLSGVWGVLMHGNKPAPPA